jgi:hypothetical protein
LLSGRDKVDFSGEKKGVERREVVERALAPKSGVVVDSSSL